MAQGPGRERCELWGRHRSHTLEKVVLESWGSQHSSQLRKHLCSDLETDSHVFQGSPDGCPLPEKQGHPSSGHLLPFPTPATSAPCLTSKQAPKVYLSTKPLVDLDQNVEEREEGSEEWEG